MSSKVINVLKSHTGALLIGGGVCLKMGAALQSLLILAPGYVALFLVISIKVKTWRDRNDHQN
jgi:hypothetical protein